MKSSVNQAGLKLGFVRIFVSDFEKAFDFYVNSLDLELDYTDNKAWAQFKSAEDISLAIELCDPNHIELGSKLVGRVTGVTFVVDDIAKTYELLKNRGVEFATAPEKQPWGGTVALFSDPDGNCLTVMESAD